MKKEDIHIGDIGRILLGDAPWEFHAAVLVRTLIIYLGLLFTLKLLGKRMTRQLTITEMAVMITLGAIVSVPMQVPERGILQGLIILLLAALFLRGLNYWSFRNKKAESVIQGKVNTLVADGVLNLEALGRLRISRQQVFALLRNKQVFQLGRVSRLYLEACGHFSLYTNNDGTPGLPLYPLHDPGLLDQAEKAAGQVACSSCGHLYPGAVVCAHCGSNDFVQAVK